MGSSDNVVAVAAAVIFVLIVVVSILARPSDARQNSVGPAKDNATFHIVVGIATVIVLGTVGTGIYLFI